MLIDPIRLSQFMALPGAAELVEAFAALPPGEVRDSAVSHVQVLARACGWTPPAPFDGRMGRVEVLAATPATPRRLPSPFAESLVATSLEGQIVERVLRGEAPHAVADDLGLKLGLVVQAMAKARREGGVVFPGDDAKPAKAAPGPKPKRRKGFAINGRRLPLMMPVPPGPWWWEDPASPVWDNPKLLPTNVERAEGSMAGLGPHDTRNYATMTRAAATRGQTLRQYLAQRFEVLRRIEAGETPVQVSLSLRITPYEVYGVLAKVGRGRMATAAARAAEAAAPAEAAAQAAEPAPAPLAPEVAESPPPATPAPGNRQREASAIAARTMAAAKWGFPDLAAYEHARARVRDLRMTGLAPAHIAIRLKQPHNFVKNAVDYWHGLGVTWPPIDIRALDRHERTEAA
jgi:hypothetical protein